MDAIRRYNGSMVNWPQLPQRNLREQAYIQAAERFPGLVIDEAEGRAYVQRGQAERNLDRLSLAFLESDTTYGAQSNDAAAGLNEILRQYESQRSAKLVKGQVLGPISLGVQLTDDQQRPLIYDDQLFDSLIHHLRLRVMWQEARLSEIAITTLVILNEPFLHLVGEPFLPFGWNDACDRLDEVLQSVIGYKGIWAGGAVDWNEVLQTSADLVVADVYDHAADLVAAAPALKELLERDGMVGLGLVPISTEELEHVTTSTLIARVEELLARFEAAGLPRSLLLQRALIAPTGGLGHLTEEQAEQVLNYAALVSQGLRDRYEV